MTTDWWHSFHTYITYSILPCINPVMNSAAAASALVHFHFLVTAKRISKMLCNNISFVYLLPNQNKQRYIYRSSQPAEASFSQRNVDVVMGWGSAEADGPFRQTLDCLNLRGQRSGESAGECFERAGEPSPWCQRWMKWWSFKCRFWSWRDFVQRDDQSQYYQWHKNTVVNTYRHN